MQIKDDLIFQCGQLQAKINVVTTICRSTVLMISTGRPAQDQ
jgi:hypothetical protein